MDQAPFESSYPLEEARRRHLEGRVLIGFHIDDQGNTFDQTIVQSEADGVLAQAALRAVQNTRYEMKWLKTDASLKVDPQVTYLMTVIYCLGRCERFEQFPDTDTVEYFDGSPPGPPTVSAQSHPLGRVDPDALVQQLRDLPPYIDPGPFSQLCPVDRPCPRRISPAEVRRREIYNQLYALGAAGVSALARGLKSPDLNLRRNVMVALGALGGGWWFHDRSPAKIDIGPALPALVAALQDPDPRVRGGAAEELGDVGPKAAAAVPKLIALLSEPDEGLRNNACIGLKGIGPAAKDALPALRHALSDPSPDVRKFAHFAIASIEGRLGPATHD
jgi:TonB family protein